MNKKTGIILASVIGVLLLCCGGVFYTTKSTVERIQKLVQGNRELVAVALDKTGKTWDEAVFAEYADDAFLTPEGRAGTKKRFEVFNHKLGKMKSLGKVSDVPGSSSLKPDGPNKGYHMTFSADAEFEHGKGKFEVTIRNDGPKSKIYAIALKSNELMEMTDSGLKDAQDRLKKTTEGTKK